MKTSWDGLKKSEVVSKLENLKEYGYGAKGKTKLKYNFKYNLRGGQKGILTFDC